MEKPCREREKEKGINNSKNFFEKTKVFFFFSGVVTFLTVGSDPCVCWLGYELSSVVRPERGGERMPHACWLNTGRDQSILESGRVQVLAFSHKMKNTGKRANLWVVVHSSVTVPLTATSWDCLEYEVSKWS